MKNLKLFVTAVVLTAVLTFGNLIEIGFAQKNLVDTTLVVSPFNLQGWQQQLTFPTMPPPPTPPSITFENGPSPPTPLPPGSVELRPGSDGNNAAQLRHPGYAGAVLPNPSMMPPPPAANELSLLSYATYVDQDGIGGQAPYIILQIDTDGDSGIEDLLFFEPAYQSATFCPSNPQPALVVDTWQTWDAFNGCWYSVFGTAGSGPGSNTVSLRTLSAALPNAVIANSSPSGLGGVRITTGFGAGAWDNFIGNVDAFRIGVGGNNTLYDFNATPASAATVSISGRVLSSSGNPVGRAKVSFSNSSGNVRTALTNPFGYYRFDEVGVGSTYVFNASAKGYSFEPQVVTVNEDMNDVNFSAQLRK